MTYDIPGPAFDGFLDAPVYSPVDCDFTDELEHLSVKKLDVVIFHFDQTGLRMESSGKIIDIRIEEKAEYVFLSTHQKIRLDNIEFLRSTYKSQYKRRSGKDTC